MKVRGGLRIYAWCDLDSGRVLADLAVGEAARKFVADEASTGYHLLRENCHMFSAFCVAGELLQRMSVSDELQDGAFTVDKLEAVIANRLNADKPIGYIQLASHVDGFSFAPTEEKVALCNQLADKAMSAYEKLKGFGPLPNMAPGGAKQNERIS